MTFTGFPAQIRLPDSGKWLVELDWTSTEARLEPQASSAVWPGVNLRDPSLSLRVTPRKVSCLHSWRWNGKLNPRAMIVFSLQLLSQFFRNRAQGFDACKIFIIGFHQRPGGIGCAGL